MRGVSWYYSWSRCMRGSRKFCQKGSIFDNFRLDYLEPPYHWKVQILQNSKGASYALCRSSEQKWFAEGIHCKSSDMLPSFFLSFFLSLLVSLKLENYTRECEFRNFDKKIKKTKNKTKKNTQKNHKKKHKNLWLNFCSNKECPKLLCGLVIGHRRRQTIPMRNSSGGKGILKGVTVCLVSAVLSTMWWHGSFQTVSIFVSFNRHCSTMNFVKEKQGGLVPPGLKRWPFQLIQHFADTTRVSPSPAGPAGCCPLNFLNLINLKFQVRAPNGCCIL